jgi:hypothetical protein
MHSLRRCEGLAAARKPWAHILFALLFGVVSLLCATVGQAGGTAFLALMAFASFPANEMRPTALLLNIVAATASNTLTRFGH